MFLKFMTLSHRNGYSMVIAAQFVIASPDQSLPRARSGVRDDRFEVRKLNNQCAP